MNIIVKIQGLLLLVYVKEREREKKIKRRERGVKLQKDAFDFLMGICFVIK